MLFQHSKYLETELLIKGNILRIVRLQGNHQLVLVRIPDSLLHQHSCNAMMLHFRVHCQINDVYSLFLMQLVCPAGVQIIPSQYKIEKGFQGMILLNQISVCA